MLFLQNPYMGSASAGEIQMSAYHPAPEKVKLHPMRPASKTQVFVPLEKDERALMLEAKLNGQKPVTFILDTGATYTSISTDLAEKLGYDLTTAPRVSITTANGRVSMPKVVLRSLTLNGYTAYNVEATVMPMPKHIPFTGLLGLNFVKRHRVTIDLDAQHLVIEPTL